MSRSEAIPLVKFINQYDDRFRAEPHFLSGDEAMIVLFDTQKAHPLPPLFHVSDYIGQAQTHMQSNRLFHRSFQEWLIAQGYSQMA